MELFFKIATKGTIQYMLMGAGTSLLVAICALTFGSILGLISAACKMSRFRLLRTIASIYVEVFRGTPMMLQIMIFYLCGPIFTRVLFGFVYTPNPLLVGIFAVSINSGAYTTELFRSAIQSIDKGQWEASKTIGLNYFQTMRYVILPQALKRILPPFVNEFIVLIKDSAMLSTIGAVELLQTATIIGGNYYNYLIPLSLAAVMYLVMTLTISAFARKLERRLAESD